MRLATITCLALSLFCLRSIAGADDLKSDVLLEGLDNPCGVAVQPETGDVFVSDSAAGRIVRVVDGEMQEVITGFPQDIYGKGPEYKIGPLGLAFADQNTLIVTGGGLVDTEEVVRVFTVPAAGEEAIDVAAATSTLGPLDSSEEMKAEGNYYAVVVTEAGVYVTANGDDEKGWIVRMSREGTRYGDVERFIATKEATGVDAPVAITLGPRGDLVVGQMGEITEPGDSLLTFYNANDGEMRLNVATGLSDITGLAYSEGSGDIQLYATDFAWAATDQGGLFRLDRTELEEGGQGCTAVRIATLDKPTALAFGPDGSLYVTVIGTPEEGDESSPSGQLLRFAPGL